MKVTWTTEGLDQETEVSLEIDFRFRRRRRRVFGLIGVDLSDAAAGFVDVVLVLVAAALV